MMTRSPFLTPRLFSALANLATRQQFLVGDLGDFALVGFEDDGDLVAQAGFDVLVQAVVGDVQLAVREPLVERRVGFVEHGGEGLLPDHMFIGQPAPVAFVIGFGFGAQGLVGVHAGHWPGPRIPGRVRRHGFRAGRIRWWCS
jgi:hypothetical protein